MDCPKCAKPVTPNATFCRYCGMRMGVQTAPAGKICPTCGTMLSAQVKFCSKCGTRMDEQAKLLICASCGTQLPPGSLFCNKCGGRVDQTPKASVCSGCGAQLAPDFLFCNLCGTPCAGAPVTAQKDEKTEPVPPSAPECLLNTETAATPELEILSPNAVSSTEPVLVLSPYTVIEPEVRPIIENEPESAVISICEPAPETITDMEAVPEEFADVEAPANKIAAESCPVCGKEHIPGMAFCINCGARLSMPQAEPTPVSAPEPISEIEPKPEPDITATPLQELAFDEVPAPAPLPAADICPICGKERIPGMAFCTGCGARLSSSQAEPAVVSVLDPVAEIEPMPEPDITATPMQGLTFEEMPLYSAPASTCPSCGKECIPGMAFCINCGARMSQVESTAVSAPEPVPDIEIKPEPDITATPLQELAFEEVPAPAPLPAADVCPTCGKERIPGMGFCIGCGARLTQPEPAAASMPVIAPSAPITPPTEISAKPLVIERIQIPEVEPEQPTPAWQSVCAACGMVVAAGLKNCPRCGSKV